jgi:ABC-type uncharacterized transport system fused permease/ATPase subunit
MKYVLITIVILEALLTSVLPYSKGWFFGSLESKIAIYTMLLYMFMNIFSLDLVQSFKAYCVTHFALQKRSVKTCSILEKTSSFKQVDNIPQRIQEDIKLMYQNRYTVHMEYWISGLILMVIILTNIHQYWLIGCALLYASISILIAYLFNGRMIRSEKNVQRREADFRKNTTNSCLYKAVQSCLVVNRVKLEYTLFTKLQNAIVLVLPYIMLLPTFIAGNMTLGDIVKVATMFQLIVINADIMISQFPILIIGKACKERVEELENG